MKILLVDDNDTNLSVLKMLIDEYSEYNDLEFDIDTAINGQIAYDKLKQELFDIVFLDIMMPVMDGFEFLKVLNKSDISPKPIIIIQTALSDKKSLEKAKLLKANAYITKPIKYYMIEAMLNRFVKDRLNGDDSFDDEFFDFDNDEFLDFDDNIDETSEQKNMLEEFNKSHKKVSAKEFLIDYDNLDYILIDLEELDSDIDDFSHSLYGNNLEGNLEELKAIMNAYSSFLNTFIDFYELSTALNMLNNVLQKTDFSNLNEKDLDFIALYLVNMLKDLKEWKDHVFEYQDAIDVFYINASVLSNCIQLENFINSKQ